MNILPILNPPAVNADDVMDIISYRKEPWVPAIILKHEADIIDHANTIERKAIVVDIDGSMVLIEPADSLKKSKTLHRVYPDSLTYSECRQAVEKQSPHSYPLINWRG